MKYKFDYESIFDYDPTPEELDLFGIENDKDIARYEGLIKKHKTPFYPDLVRLFNFRNSQDQVKKYLLKIEDPELRFTTAYALMNLAHYAPD